jgi:hypothetical protein
MPTGGAMKQQWCCCGLKKLGGSIHHNGERRRAPVKMGIWLLNEHNANIKKVPALTIAGTGSIV